MTFDEWSAQIKREISEAGFEVGDYRGFPLVKHPSKNQDVIRLLKLELSLLHCQNIYAEGVRFTPVTLAAP